jgi:Protein of unknown function (DUF2934)
LAFDVTEIAMPTKAKVSSPRGKRAAPKSPDFTPAEVKAQPAATPRDENERRTMIAVAAYFRAAARGFAPGDPVQDWIMAEAEIAKKFSH